MLIDSLYKIYVEQIATKLAIWKKQPLIRTLKFESGVVYNLCAFLVFLVVYPTKSSPSNYRVMSRKYEGSIDKRTAFDKLRQRVYGVICFFEHLCFGVFANCYRNAMRRSLNVRLSSRRSQPIVVSKGAFYNVRPSTVSRSGLGEVRKYSLF